MDIKETRKWKQAENVQEKQGEDLGNREDGDV